MCVGENECCSTGRVYKQTRYSHPHKSLLQHDTSHGIEAVQGAGVFFYRVLYRDVLSALDFLSRVNWPGQFYRAQFSRLNYPLESGKLPGRKTSWAVRTGLKMGKLPICPVSLPILSPVRTGLYTEECQQMEVGWIEEVKLWRVEE